MKVDELSDHASKHGLFGEKFATVSKTLMLLQMLLVMLIWSSLEVALLWWPKWCEKTLVR